MLLLSTVSTNNIIILLSNSYNHYDCKDLQLVDPMVDDCLRCNIMTTRQKARLTMDLLLSSGEIKQ